METSGVRDWLFRILMFEAEAEQFREAGMHVGADGSKLERSKLYNNLAPFPVELRNGSMRMAGLYALMYCFENSVRDLIKERLLEKYGARWWEDGVPKKIREFADNRIDSAEKDSWLESENHEQLAFVEFGHLADIIINEWDTFADLIPSQHWLKQRMDELEKTRHFVAHHRLLLPTEFQRIEMYIADWNRTVGV